MAYPGCRIDTIPSNVSTWISSVRRRTLRRAEGCQGTLSLRRDAMRSPAIQTPCARTRRVAMQVDEWGWRRASVASLAGRAPRPFRSGARHTTARPAPAPQTRAELGLPRDAAFFLIEFGLQFQAPEHGLRHVLLHHPVRHAQHLADFEISHAVDLCIDERAPRPVG